MTLPKNTVKYKDLPPDIKSYKATVFNKVGFSAETEKWTNGTEPRV